MSWRRLIPLVLVGVLSMAVAAAAALGAAQSPKSPAVLSLEAQSKLFHADVERTLASKSFTVHFAGQSTVYQSPNRTQVVETPGLFGLGITFVTIGSSSYIDSGGEWSKMPFALPGFEGSSEALGYLRALSSFKRARLHGATYTVRGVFSDLPKALVTLIFTVVTHGPNNETGASFTPPHPNQHAKVIGRVVVDDGRVTSETFTALESSPSRGRAAPSPTGTITYAHFDSSPAITAPTKADLNQPASPCGPTASGSCQVTTKGAAPHSALCRAIRDRPQRFCSRSHRTSSGGTEITTMGQNQEVGARCLDAREFAGAGGRAVSALSATQHSGGGASRNHISPRREARSAQVQELCSVQRLEYGHRRKDDWSVRGIGAVREDAMRWDDYLFQPGPGHPRTALSTAGQ